MRPHQWVKNLFVFAPLVFAKELTDVQMLSRTVLGFVLFCLTSSAVYIMNDLVDAQADRAHPIKRSRPIASGEVTRDAAIGAASALVVVSIAASLLLGVPFFGALVGYLFLNIAYSFSLKRVAYLDVLCIACGFEFRILAGAFAAEVQPSTYLLLVTFLLATYLGFGKRLHELLQNEGSYDHRLVLKGYSKSVLSGLLFGSAALTITAYAAYTLDPSTVRFFGTDKLTWSIPFAVFGVVRFLYLVRNRPESESPTEEMLRDPPFVINLALWGVTILAVIYSMANDLG